MSLEAILELRDKFKTINELCKVRKAEIKQIKKEEKRK